MKIYFYDHLKLSILNLKNTHTQTNKKPEPETPPPKEARYICLWNCDVCVYMAILSCCFYLCKAVGFRMCILYHIVCLDQIKEGFDVCVWTNIVIIIFFLKESAYSAFIVMYAWGRMSPVNAQVQILCCLLEEKKSFYFIYELFW